MKMQSRASFQEDVRSVDAYLETIAEPARSTLMQLRESIRSVAPAGTLEGFYYGVPAFFLGKGLAGYNAGKRFCSYYPMSGRVITALKQELQGYETTRGSIHFALDTPLPTALVRTLITRRVAEIEGGQR
jgi:uncharacterized protein YdhG (YjbR/CyaY superfamily)